MRKEGEYLYTITEYDRERDGKTMFTVFNHKTCELREGPDLPKLLKGLIRDHRED